VQCRRQDFLETEVKPPTFGAVWFDAANDLVALFAGTQTWVLKIRPVFERVSASLVRRY
jgi:hypothetical protein